MTSPQNEKSTSISEFAKKVVLTSLGSASMAKDVLIENSLKRDLVSGLLSYAEKRKDDIMTLLAAEVSKFLGKLDVSGEIKKALSGLSINLQASIDFKEKEKGLHPKISIRKAKVQKD